MKVFVRAKTGAKMEKIEQIDSDYFLIWTKEPPKENRANFRIIELLADFLAVPNSSIRLLKGRRFKEKVFEIK